MSKAGAATFTDRLVPAARSLAPSAEYLRHLSLSADEGVIRLASNENTEPPSPAVARALADAFGDANLSPPPISPLARELARRHGVDVDRILVTAGSTEVIDAALRTFVRAGDEVVFPSPSWPVCRQRLAALEATVVEVPLECDQRTWHYRVGALLEAVTAATKLIYVCTPNNPTGNPIAPADLARLAQTGLPLLVDAAYCDFEPRVDIVAFARDRENVILTRTFSKAYCLAGLRVGYALGGREIIGYVERMLVPGSAVSNAALHAGLAALSDDRYYERQTARITAERDRLTVALRALGIGVWESWGNFVPIDARAFPGLAGGLADALRARRIVTRPFGDILRISVGVARENDAVIAAIASIIGQ